MATKAKTPAGLKEAVKEEVRGAEQDAKTGNVATRKQSDGGPQDLPTGTRRSHPA